MAMTTIAQLSQKTSDFTHVYYSSMGSSSGDYSNPDFELPVIEGSINYSMGEVDYEYVKLVSGAIWATKRTKGDPDISFQIATNNAAIAALFGKTSNVSSIKTPTNSEGISGIKVDLTAVKVAKGTLIFTDDIGNAEILPDCEMTAARGKDNVAYWNVKVVPGNTILMTT